MAYQVLARKYRPQRFSDVAGQDHVTRTLMNALAQGRIAHGYIFSGHRGIGKTTIARILAMALNCRTEIGSAQRPTPEPCSVCVSCTEIRAGNAVDVIEVDAATNRGIDEIRELRDAARYRPSRDRYKIYILDEAHQITDAAFNALLKTLEEPPDHVVFMMATTQPEDIPQTIRSRCQHFSFHAVKFDDILAQLRSIAAEENVAAEDEALALLAEAGDGSMRDALSIMDQAIASAPFDEGRARLDAAQIRELMGTVPNTVFERILEAVSENQSAPVIEEINRLLNAGNSAAQLARQCVRYLRNTLMARIAGESSELLQLSPDERARAGRSALLFTEEELTRFLQVMLRTFDDLNYRQEQRFHLELGLLKLVHLQRLVPVEQLLSQLGGKASGPSSIPAPAPTRLGGGPLPMRAAATPAPSFPPLPPSPPRPPSFSPFEADTSRKRESMEAPTLESLPAATAAEPERPTARGAERSPVTSGTGFPATKGAPAPETTSGALALAPQPSVPEPVTEAAPALALGAALDLDRLRDAVCSALEAAGHNTAASLLDAGTWSETAEQVRIGVVAKKTMLGLVMTPEAEKITRSAARPFTPKPIAVTPGEGTAAARASAPRAASNGSVQATALEHPLVKTARELFNAQVHSVVDLRENKR
jgi:DNA polymerase-3 subunit gamma/tau